MNATTLLFLYLGFMSIMGFSQGSFPLPVTDIDVCDNTKITFFPQVIPIEVSAKSPGWVLIDQFSDEFNQPNLNTVKWNVRGPFCHEMSKDAMFRDTDTTVQINSNCLILKAHQNNDSIACTDEKGITKYYQYSSGYISSQQSVRYGFFEIKSKMPANICLNPAFWTIGQIGDPILRYDEIDIFEFPPGDFLNTHFRQAVIHRYPFSSGTGTLAREIECKNVQLNNPFASDTIVWGVEWLPTEINFFINGNWCNGFKFANSTNCINPYQYGNPGLFTCVDFTYALPQWFQLSLALNYFDGYPPINLSEGWAIDWIRSYKLIQTNLNYWPASISLSDPLLAKVHLSVRVGGDGNHSGVIPANSNLTLWSKSHILLDKGFAIGTGTSLTLRAIDPAPDLFVVDEP
jgi:hypothetical protein